MDAATTTSAAVLPARSSQNYSAVFAFAQAMADKMGREVGIEKTREFGTTVYTFKQLPNPENRSGWELTCEVVRPYKIALPPRPTAPTITRRDMDAAAAEAAKAMPHTRKSVEWAYPLSEHAWRFHRPGGCWVVEITTLGNPTEVRAVSGHDERAEALTAAQAIPCEWQSSFVAIFPEEAK